MKTHRMKSWGSFLVLAAFLLGASACSTQMRPEGDGDGDAPGATPEKRMLQPAYMTLSLSQPSVKWDRSDSTEIIVTVLDSNRVAVRNAVVVFSADGGQLQTSPGFEMGAGVDGGDEAMGVLTNDQGVAKMIFSTDGNQNVQTVTVTARVVSATYWYYAVVPSDLIQDIVVHVVDPEETDTPPEALQPMYLSLSLSQPTVKRDNTDSTEIIAAVVDKNRVAVMGAVLSFSADSGLLAPVAGYAQAESGILTDSNGIARIRFSAGGVRGDETVTVLARVVGGPHWSYITIPESLRQSISIRVVDPETDETSPEALQPTALTLAASQPSVAWGNEDFSEITAIVIDRNRNAVGNAVVSFSTNAGLLSPVAGYTQTESGVLTDELGVAKIRFSAGNERTDMPAAITAKVTSAPVWYHTGIPESLIKTIKIQIASSEALQPADLSLSVSKTHVAWDNIDTADVIVSVVDGNRVAVKGAVVLFNASGGQLTPAAGYEQIESGIVADENGMAKMIFSSGTIKTAETVTIAVYVTGAPHWYYNVTPDYLSKRTNIQVVQPPITEDTPRPELQPETLSLSLSRPQVKTDNSDHTTITAVVLDSGRMGVKDALVVFSADGGQLSPAPGFPLQPNGGVLANERGEAQVRFSSGSSSLSNRTVTVEARVVDAPHWYYFGTPLNLVKIIPVQVTGTTVAIDASRTVLSIGGNDTANCTITVQDAGGRPIYDVQVSIGVAPGSIGAVQLSRTSGVTDTMGRVYLTVRGTRAGSVTVQASALGAIGSREFTVSELVAAFTITDPAADTVAQPTGVPLTVTVQSPNPGPSNKVVFVTTLGGWAGGTQMLAVACGLVETFPGSGVFVNGASADLQSNLSGVANVEVYDADDPTMKDTLTVAFSAPAAEAATIDLQASATTLPPSTTAGVSNSINLYATVRTANNQVVGGAAVQFYILNPTGGGESISPVVVLTDSQGLARTKLTSGTRSSGADGILVVAELVDVPGIKDDIEIIIGGTGVSLSIGIANVVIADHPTTYETPCAVMVNDSAGNPISGAQVTLKLWPTRYRTGDWCQTGGVPLYIVYTIRNDGIIEEWDGYYPHINEDENRNLILDPGEDGFFDAFGNLDPLAYNTMIEVGDPPQFERYLPAGHGDGKLTPGLSDAGTVPSIVETDENGLADFSHIYLRNFAVWLEVEITASTVVFGTETSTTSVRWLEILESDTQYHKPSRFNR